ncbi:MAG TPA: hypothetical protein VFE46_03340 [Pirellulales bacterium]|nr:hypothetical protein [Pirellulales bacterium]
MDAASSTHDQARTAHEVLVLESRVAHEARTAELRISHFKKYRSGPVALYSVALFAGLAMAVGQRPACADDAVPSNTTAAPGTRLVWHPVRPQRSDDKASDSAASGSSSSSSTDKDTATANKSQSSSKNAVQKHAVVTAEFDDPAIENSISAEQPKVKTKVRLTAGNSSGNNSGNLALTDPFGDNLPSVKTSHRIAMTPPDEIDSLPPPAAQSGPSSMRIEPAQQDPAELSAPEPMRSGLPTHTYQTQLPGPPTPGGTPDLLPGGEPQFSRQTHSNPALACKEDYDQIKAMTLNKLNVDIVPPGNSAKGDQVPFECSLSTDPFAPRCWPGTTYTWKASALCHKPLYFEEEALERYGHSCGPWGLEYAKSVGHFFGNLVLLPYMVGVYTPNECIYDLGVYRPGDCAPWICDPFPLSCRGLCTGAVGYSGVAALFP